jgi:hypothetical protein
VEEARHLYRLMMMCVYAGGRDKKVARGVEKRYEEREKATYIRDDIYNLNYLLR